MKVILLSGRNIEYYPEEIFEVNDIIVICNQDQKGKIPKSILEKLYSVHVVNETYNSDYKFMEFNENEVLKIVENYSDSFKIKIVCSQEAQLSLAANIRKKLKLEGMLPPILELFRDKIKMKSKIDADKKVRTPKYIEDIDLSIGEIKLYDLCVKKLGNNFILKPIFSVGSRGVYKIFSKEDFSKFYSENCNQYCPYEAEEFIFGTFYHVDFAIQNKRVIYHFVSEYTFPNADFQEGKNLGSIPLIHDSILVQQMKKTSLDAITSLTMPDGSFHMEIFYTDKQELVFIETAIRPAGLYAVKAYQKTFGVNIYEIDFKIQCEENINTITFPEKINRIASFVVFPKRNGTVSKLHEPKLESLSEIKWNIKIGDNITATTTNIESAGFLEFENSNYDEIKKDFYYLKNEFKPVSYE